MYFCDGCTHSSNNCLACAANRIAVKGGACVCPAGTFDDKKYPECAPCESKCKTCDGSNDNCTECNGNRINIPSCECDVERGYYEAGTKNCQKCSAKC